MTERKHFLVSCDEPFFYLNDYAVTPSSVPLDGVEDATVERWKKAYEEWAYVQDEMSAVARSHEERRRRKWAEVLGKAG